MNQDEKSKVIALGILLSAVVLLVNFWQEDVKLTPSANKVIRVAASAPSYTPPVPLKAIRGSRSLPVEGDNTVFGTIAIMTDRISDINVATGMSTRFVPVSAKALAYDYFVNDELLHHYRAEATVPPDGFLASLSSDRKEGFRLSPGQGQEDVRMAYVIYFGSQPPENWYARALQTMGK